MFKTIVQQTLILAAALGTSMSVNAADLICKLNYEVKNFSGTSVPQSKTFQVNERTSSNAKFLQINEEFTLVGQPLYLTVTHITPRDGIEINAYTYVGLHKKIAQGYENIVGMDFTPDLSSGKARFTVGGPGANVSQYLGRLNIVCEATL